MERQRVTEVVKKHIVEIVEDLDPSTIDMSTSMKDMGANSLDIVEIVSCVMRELRVKVPRVELQNLQTVDEFVNLLNVLVQEKEG